VTAPKTTLPDPDGDSGAATGRGAVEPDDAQPTVFVASHDVLFVETPSSVCDACSRPLGEGEPAEGYEIPGRGVYLWTRGDETRVETVELCASCASAIGMTALARWEIEEEEG
jgi:hypothetical protein